MMEPPALFSATRCYAVIFAALCRVHSVK